MLIDYLFPEYLQIMGKVPFIEILSYGIACLIVTDVTTLSSYKSLYSLGLITCRYMLIAVLCYIMYSGLH